MTEPTLTIDEILAAFTPVDQPYQRATVAAALLQREAIIPHLIALLEQALADPASQDESVSFTYALMLLGHFRASTAHDVIVKLLRLSKESEGTDRLFGDLINSNVPMILLRTCGGSVEQIQALILDRQADDYCRGAGAQALTYAVVEGFISREAALEFMSALFTSEEADTESAFWSQLMVLVDDLYPSEQVETLQAAFERGLIDEWIIGIEDIEETLATGTIESALQAVRAEMARDTLDDIHASMQWWAMFKPASAQGRDSTMLAKPPTADPLMAKKTAAAQAKKKQKRKMVKATRKKNRRK